MKKLALLVWVILITPLVIKGQEIIKLTYEEAVEIALENNITLNQNRNQLDVFKVNRTEAQMQFTPSVNGSLAASQAEGRFFDQTKGDIVDQRIRNVNGALNAQLVIFSGFSRIQNMRSANYALDAWRKNIDRTAQDVMVAVAEQYLQTLLDQQLLAIAQENLSAQKALLEQIEEFYAAGTRNIVDKYNQEAQVQNQEVAVIRAENVFENDLALLGETLMLDPGFEIELVQQDSNLEDKVLQDISLEQLYQEALAQRPDLQQLKYQEISNNYAFKAARRNFIPTLAIFGRYASNYSSAIDQITDGTSGEVIKADFQYQFFTLNPNNALGVSLQIPIWNQYRNVRQQVAAKVDYQNSQLEKEGLKRSIYTELQTAYNDYQAAKKNYFASIAQVASAEHALQLQRESYEEGLSNLVEVTQANQLYIEAAANQAQATYTLIFQEIILDYFTGTL